MQELLVLQHVTHETVAAIESPLRRHGLRLHCVNFEEHPDAQPSADRCGGLIVLGGPMNVDQVDRFPHLGLETELIRAVIQRRVPVLGICLGAQLIAKALGAKVYAGGEKEIGWYDLTVTEAARTDPLFAHLHATERVFQWHGDTFDIPAGAVRLASSTLFPNQAFRYRDNVYALQFHLEVDEPVIERWLRVTINRQEIAALYGRIDPDAIRADTGLYIDRLRTLGERMFKKFAALFRPPESRSDRGHTPSGSVGAD
jgi:GMP synthase (glutamine-hydrolysing)